MVVEFVVRLNLETYPNSQELPWVYADVIFNRNRDMYVSSAAGVRFRVRLVNKQNGPFVLTGARWRVFAMLNLNEDVQLLNFVEEGDESFFVTGYNWDGSEFAGYNMIAGRFLRFMSTVTPYLDVPQTLPPAFLQGLGNEAQIRVKANGVNFVVNVRSVSVGGGNGPRMYEMDMDDWNVVEENVELDPGMIVIFTRKCMDKLLLTAFSVHGHLTTDAHFIGATNLLRIQPPLLPAERNHDRMIHVCQWPSHKDHFLERNTFYKRFFDIYDRERLAIPANFLTNRQFHTFTKVLMKHRGVQYVMTLELVFHRENPSRINHINVLGPWRQFAERVGFAYDKLIRFRFMHMIEDLDVGADEEAHYPVFHLC